MIVSTFGRGLDLSPAVVINCERRYESLRERNARQRQHKSENVLAGADFSIGTRAEGTQRVRRKSIPTARLLELITRYPGVIPSILNNPHDPNRTHGRRREKGESGCEKERKCKRELSLPLLLTYRYYCRLRALRARVMDLVRSRARRGISCSRDRY